MSLKKRILLAIFLVIVAGTVYIYNEYNRSNANVASEESAFTVQATELVDAFRENDSAASKKYIGKIISITGLVKNMNQDERGYYTLNLGDTSSMSSVRCSVDSMYTARATAIKPGMTIKIKGNCTGYNEDELLGLDVIVNRCVIEGN
jgi:hypothetical protein